jgi:cation transport regulator ChaC
LAQYLFGYGSLIDAASRAKTGDTGRAYPVRVVGLQRAWHVVAPRSGYTVLGVTPRQKASCNGVLIEIAPHELPRFDARERLYHRVIVPQQAVTSLSGERLSFTTIWAYVTSRPGEPSDAYPLVQSYIDVVLTGCLAIGVDFAVEFIQTTRGWSPAWLNERTHPRYQRAMTDPPQAAEIDRQLQALVPHAFSHRHDIMR